MLARLDARSSCIQVSGYAAIAALAWTNHDTGRWVGSTAQLNGHTSGILRDGRAAMLLGPRCRSCHAFLTVADEGAQNALGMDHLCRRCATKYRAICRAFNDRLPRKHEFFCRVCGVIRSDVERLPVEAGERRRWRCRSCRREQCRIPHLRWAQRRLG